MSDGKEKQSWQQALSDLITDPAELFELLNLDPVLLPDAYQVAKIFPLRVPKGFLKRIKRGDAYDPLLRQILPLGEELKEVYQYDQDPLQEEKFNPVPGLLHKYSSRVLVMLGNTCAVHCRYCFRRFFPYEENNPGRKGWDDIFAYIQNRESISEVILSGGDPLAVNDKLLKSFSDRLSLIKHIKRLRIHTRIPIFLPERISPDLLSWLDSLVLKPIIVIHANHPQEINDEVRDALQKLHAIGVTLLNQAVLLKGVNDDANILIELSETLFAANVLPYYLHKLDKVTGSAHFEVSDSKIQDLFAELCKNLPGYLVPRLVREEANAFSKTHLLTALYTG